MEKRIQAGTDVDFFISEWHNYTESGRGVLLKNRGFISHKPAEYEHNNQRDVKTANYANK
jgi:hypothetical protein